MDSSHAGFIHSSDARPTLLLRTGPTIPTTEREAPTETETDMTTALVLNIVLAAVVVVTIVGMLAWSIVGQDRDAATGLLRSARRRRRTTARAQFIGRTVRNGA